MTEAALTAKSVLESLAMMAVQGTLLALLALVLVRGRKIRPAWQAAVWLIVIVKFALPWSPALPWSLADVMAMLRGDLAGGPVVVGAPVASGDAAIAQVSIGWLMLGAAWAAGAAFVAVRAILRDRQTVLAARRAPEAPADARLTLAELAARSWLTRRARLVVGTAAIGPHVVGVLRPIIVVPPALLDHRDLLRAALLHELAHVRRLDAVARLLQLLARAAFWWWPVVALASRRLDSARESACDARALEIGRLSPPVYARLLLQMAQLRPASAASLAAHALDHRIASVLGPPMRTRLGIVHGIALLAWGAMALGGARSAEARGVETCVYTPQLAEALRQAHPEADIDNDGVLSHDEACEFQAELRKAAGGPDKLSTLDEATAELLAEPLCCNSEAVDGPYAPSCRAAE